MKRNTPQPLKPHVANIKFAWHSQFITMTDDADATNILVLHMDEWEKTKANIDNIVNHLKQNKDNP